MAEEPLEVLLRVRRLAVDRARRALADCIDAEGEASARCREIRSAIARETAAASDIGAGDEAVEDFATWLHAVLPEQAAAEAALQAAEAQTVEARVVLAAARAGARAIETMLDKKAAEQRQQRQRAEQRVLDEAARARVGLE